MHPIFHRNFNKQYAKVNKKTRMQFEERVVIFMKTPFHPLLNNHSVDDVFPNCRSINVTGDYRAIYKQEGGITIFVKIGTHSELYGK